MSENLQTSFVVQKPGFAADIVPVTENIWSELDQNYGQFAGHALIASFSFDDDWPTWEMHPRGDEIVALISGTAELIMRTASGDIRQTLSTPGDFVVVPKGTWHTAKVAEPTQMIFVTPGEGTLNRETPDEDGN